MPTRRRFQGRKIGKGGRGKQAGWASCRRAGGFRDADLASVAHRPRRGNGLPPREPVSAQAVHAGSSSPSSRGCCRNSVSTACLPSCRRLRRTRPFLTRLCRFFSRELSNIPWKRADVPWQSTRDRGRDRSRCRSRGRYRRRQRYRPRGRGEGSDMGGGGMSCLRHIPPRATQPHTHPRSC